MALVPQGGMFPGPVMGGGAPSPGGFGPSPALRFGMGGANAQGMQRLMQLMALRRRLAGQMGNAVPAQAMSGGMVTGPAQLGHGLQDVSGGSPADALQQQYLLQLVKSLQGGSYVPGTPALRPGANY